MKRFIAVVVLVGAFEFQARGQDKTLPVPKENSRTSYQAGADEGDKAKPKECCDFLCNIIILNNTGTKLKGWIRATIHGLPGYVEIDARCQNGAAIAHPCEHPWHLWFKKIKIGVWDGEQTA